MSQSEMIEMESKVATSGQNRSQSSPTSRNFCRLCKRGSSNGVIIRPCLCTNRKEFVHIYCLEVYTTRKRIRHCKFCHTPFPLKQKSKSLLEWCKNRDAWQRMLQDIYGSFFKIFGLLLIDLGLIALIVYLYSNMLKILQVEQYILVVFFNSILLIIFIVSIFIQIIKIKGPVKRIRESCHRWYASNQEMKVTSNISHIVFEIL